jgi:hypothetical protein
VRAGLLTPRALFAVLGATATATAADVRVRAVDGVDDAAEADLREVRVTVPEGATQRTVVVRFGGEVIDEGPTVELTLGSAPEVYGSSCLPFAGGPVVLRFDATSRPQRATVRVGDGSRRAIVWLGLDAHELVVHVPRAVLDQAPGCIAARSIGSGDDTLGPEVPSAGAWALLSAPRESRRTGALSVHVASTLDPARVRFQVGRSFGPETSFDPSGPWRALATPFDSVVTDRRPRQPAANLVWRAIVVDGDGTAYLPPRAVRFVDRTPPRAVVRPTQATAGRRIAIRGTVVDDSGRAALTVELLDGSRLVGRARHGLQPVSLLGPVLARFATRAVDAGRLAACAVATDAAGNRSPRTCAAVVLRAPTPPRPVTPPTPPTPPPSRCDPSYPTVCIPPPPPDLDCDDVPYRNFVVRPPDPHNFDGNGDGYGCES